MSNILVFVDLKARLTDSKPTALVFSATDIESGDNGDLLVWHDEVLKYTINNRDLRTGAARVRIRPEVF